ncbi:hypothetical protein B4O97_14175 [Marispirochaeta aestuarii]|uniref:DUF7670 domain-containing protein n=1 Tax=Marispirochaeta aestuarii TaxID=1963862 RepID=A0A1Y1RVH4_9SPIO|nr:hypothetical protein [Marispirochaeta aestuarii]ORC34029.1 hypothetical protein B4O97_14175 [Marispirochaeta aestuarii]
MIGFISTRVIRWTARILSALIILIGLPFYFGYGSPLPFADPAYSTLDNLWLIIFPLMFIGLGLGWRYEKLGAVLVLMPLSIGFAAGMITEGEIPVFMGVPFLAGLLYGISEFTRPHAKG